MLQGTPELIIMEEYISSSSLNLIKAKSRTGTGITGLISIYSDVYSVPLACGFPYLPSYLPYLLSEVRGL